jgi:hypothetical protein
MPLNEFSAFARIVHQTISMLNGLATYYIEFFLYLSSNSHHYNTSHDQK